MPQYALTCRIDLPADFRRADFLAFHRRDALMLAERVSDERLDKGLFWAGAPACLSLRFTAGQVVAELAVDAARPAEARDDDKTLSDLVRRMLGLPQPIAEFEQRYRQHPQLGPLLAAHPGLRVPLTATPFEALTWAVTGQQISVSAAVAVRRKFIQALGSRHSDGLWCYPIATQVAASSEEVLRQAGFSQSKALTLLALSRGVVEQALPLDQWISQPLEELIRSRLLAIRGIGPWTINYALLRGYGCLDGSLHGDAAVRRKLQALLGPTVIVNEAFAQRWLADFAPWRALVAAHLWAMQDAVAA